MATVCLNMIVRNEAHVLKRCLESVKPFITNWVIHDTGSTDGTQKLIRKLLKGIPGDLHEHPWQSFSHNRNLALADTRGKADYLLFIDADEIWNYAEGYKFPELTADSYTMTIRQLQAADCRRIALVRSSLKWSWVGLLHEVITAPDALTTEHLIGVTNVCNEQLGARACDPNLRVRDAKVLVAALMKDPTNTRYMYYTGISYLAAGKYDQSEIYFNRYIKAKPPVTEELYLTFYHLAIAQMKQGKLDIASQHFATAYELRPWRAEPLKMLADIHRQQNHPRLGLEMARLAVKIPYPTGESCIEYLTYDHQSLIELANCALLCGQWLEGLMACQQLLANKELPTIYKASILKNQQLALQNLE